MNRILTTFLFLFVLSSAYTQAIRKNGTNHVNLKYSQLKYGYEFGVGYESYFLTDWSYRAGVSVENSKVINTSYDIYKISGGVNRSYILLTDLYLNGALDVYGAYNSISNEYYEEDNFMSCGVSLEPRLEYYILSNISISLSVNVFRDFFSKFRNTHYSYNLLLTYKL